jgi:hypothetical protein
LDEVSDVRSVKSSQAAEESNVRYRQYYTQACLLGLVQKRSLDDACLHVGVHYAYRVGNYYALRRKFLMKLIVSWFTGFLQLHRGLQLV